MHNQDPVLPTNLLKSDWKVGHKSNESNCECCCEEVMWSDWELKYWSPSENMVPPCFSKVSWLFRHLAFSCPQMIAWVNSPRLQWDFKEITSFLKIQIFHQQNMIKNLDCYFLIYLHFVLFSLLELISQWKPKKAWQMCETRNKLILWGTYLYRFSIYILNIQIYNSIFL